MRREQTWRRVALALQGDSRRGARMLNWRRLSARGHVEACGGWSGVSVQQCPRTEDSRRWSNGALAVDRLGGGRREAGVNLAQSCQTSNNCVSSAFFLFGALSSHPLSFGGATGCKPCLGSPRDLDGQRCHCSSSLFSVEMSSRRSFCQKFSQTAGASFLKISCPLVAQSYLLQVGHVGWP